MADPVPILIMISGAVAIVAVALIWVAVVKGSKVYKWGEILLFHRPALPWSIAGFALVGLDLAFMAVWTTAVSA